MHFMESMRNVQGARNKYMMEGWPDCNVSSGNFKRFYEMMYENLGAFAIQ